MDKKEFNKEANSFSMSSVFMFTPYNITYMRFFSIGYIKIIKKTCQILEL